MIVTLVLLIILVVFLAFFVGMNLSNTCNIWFFKNFENLPVSILVFIAFAAGVLIALLCFLIFKLKSPSDKEKVREGVQYELRKMEKRNKKLREKQGKHPVAPVQPSDADKTVIAVEPKKTTLAKDSENK